MSSPPPPYQAADPGSKGYPVEGGYPPTQGPTPTAYPVPGAPPANAYPPPGQAYPHLQPYAVQAQPVATAVVVAPGTTYLGDIPTQTLCPHCHATIVTSTE